MSDKTSGSLEEFQKYTSKKCKVQILCYLLAYANYYKVSF